MTDETEETGLTEPKSEEPGIAISYEELEQAGAKTKSQIIRYLDSLGHSRASIARFLGVKYQHVRNVLTQPQKRLIKAQQEAARLAKQHPSTLTERQKILLGQSPPLEPSVLQTEEPEESEKPPNPDDDGNDGWISPGLQRLRDNKF